MGSEVSRNRPTLVTPQQPITPAISRDLLLVPIAWVGLIPYWGLVRPTFPGLLKKQADHIWTHQDWAWHLKQIAKVLGNVTITVWWTLGLISSSQFIGNRADVPHSIWVASLSVVRETKGQGEEAWAADIGKCKQIEKRFRLVMATGRHMMSMELTLS